MLFLFSRDISAKKFAEFAHAWLATRVCHSSETGHNQFFPSFIYLLLIIRPPPELLPKSWSKYTTFLCYDRWNGDVMPLHLLRPCYVALGQVLIGLRNFVNWVSSFPSRAQCFSEGEIKRDYYYSGTINRPYKFVLINTVLQAGIDPPFVRGNAESTE